MVLGTQGNRFVQRIKNLTAEYNRKVQVALEEAAQKKDNVAGDLAIWWKDDGEVTRNRLVVVPRDQDLWREIISSYHDSITAGHPGRYKTREKIQQDYFWHRMIDDVNKYVDGCPMCPQVKPVRSNFLLI